MPRIALLPLLLLAACGARSTPRTSSTTCRPPPGSHETTFLLFQSQNQDAFHLKEVKGLTPDPACSDVRARPFDEAAFTGELDALHCGGATVASFAGWRVRFYDGINGQLQVHYVVESPQALHILIDSTSGGMPGGAIDKQTFAVVLPPAGKPIRECTSTTDLGSYDGPMPP